ncbi:MAG: hypothetical protein JWM78_185 [Verrucomicrobiaceae bacterium]|nr:hypothetical protein [Verrucomicrobiaceae bacterium]
MIAVRVPRSLKIIVLIYLAYLALLMLVAMPALNLLAPKIYREQTGRELKLDKIIWINPFTLALNVRGASSANSDGSAFWSLQQLRVNVALASIWRRHIVLDELQLTRLNLQIDQKNAEQFNFSEILAYRAQHFPATAQPKTKTDDSTAIFPIDISSVIFSAAHIGIKAPYLSEPFALDLNDTTIKLADITTVAEKNNDSKQSPLRTGAIDIALKSIGIKLLREQEPFATQLKDLHIASKEIALGATQEQPLSLTITDASGGQLNVKANAALGAKHSSGTVTLRNLDLVPAWRYLSPKFAFVTQRAALDGDMQFNVNWSEPLHYALTNSRLNLHDVQLQSKLDDKTNIALAALQIDGVAVDSAQPQAKIAKILLRDFTLSGSNQDMQISVLDMLHVASTDEESTSPPWQIQIDDIETQGGAIHWQASQLPDLPIVIAPLSAHVSHVLWPQAAPLQLQFDTTINDTAKLALQGELIPAEVTGKINGEVSGLPLEWANTLFGQYMHATLHSGQLSARVQATLEQGAPITLQSEGSVDKFELQSLPEKRKLLAWNQLQWKQLAVDLPKQQLQLQLASIDQPWAQFRINKGGTNNFQQLIITQPAAQKSDAQKTANKNPAPQKNAAKQNDKPWQLAIDTVHIEKANLDFRDDSLSRAFRTNIADFTGDISGISNRAKGENAKVALKGTVDGYAPVALSGTINPFGKPPAMKIALDITNLDLATLTPYSGTYAGYVIDGGRLSVQLVYTLQDNRIVGTNHIVVNQMQLGPQVSGPKVMDLPLRFAIYLLTDSNGTMDLGVDVTGSVDDPDFSVGSIIWKAFRNVIVKTVTSPFRALANLVGGGDHDDLDRVDFTAGSDQIASEHKEKLHTLVDALNKKSALKLGLTGHVSPSRDIEALRDGDLSSALIALGSLNAADIQQQSKNWQRAVAKLFGNRFPDRKSEKLEPMQMNDAMRDNVELPSSALSELANRRALAVKQLLVTDIGLAADRAFVKPVDIGADKTPGATVTMEVN